jgi:glucose-6-phosphate-specific signal transduction histidine kinase
MIPNFITSLSYFIYQRKTDGLNRTLRSVELDEIELEKYIEFVVKEVRKGSQQ